MTLAPEQTYQTLHTTHIQAQLAQATPMVRQYLAVKNQYPGVLLLYRMGDFYETFFEDALTMAKALEITLTGRDAGPLGRIPMAGIPVKAADSYLPRLLAQNFRVALCEQMEDPALAKGLVERKVVRVLSSGTLTEATLLKNESHNFLAAIHLDQSQDRCGLAYCDVTTGAFHAAEMTYAQLLSELDRLQPVELLTPGRMTHVARGEGVSEQVADVPPELAALCACTPLEDLAFSSSDTQGALRDLFRVSTLDGFGLGDAPEALKAAGAIAHYLRHTFIEGLPVFDTLQRYSLNNTVAMTATTRRNLELLATVRDHRTEGSLFWVLNKTATPMGTRLLRQWVSQPLTHLPEIESRLEGLEELVESPDIREDVRRLLPGIYDLERLAMRVANLSAAPRDLVALKQSLQRLPQLAQALSGSRSFHLLRMQGFPPELPQVIALIDRALEETPAVTVKDGGVLRTGYNDALDRLRHTLTDQETWLADYEAQQRERTGIRTLKVSFNNAFGYFIEISKAAAKQAPPDYHRKQTLTNAERYTTEALKTQEQAVLEAQANLYEVELRLFNELREQLLPHAALLKDCAHRVAVLDALQSLATVAVEQGYVKPVLETGSTSHVLHIEGGRHPVVEKRVPMGRFVPNPCHLAGAPAGSHTSGELPQVLIITGPNMAGKSTYMRQVALIVLMAQMGSFVPAQYCKLSLVDALYTRVGAVDDLAAGQSTFMVEMTETAQILNGATAKSLVLLDEVGRGTSTYDGVAIAWSVVEHLVTALGCRTLFATHYHELNALESLYPGAVQNVRVCVTEVEDHIEFLHTVEPGAAQKSYGIQVARMAGVPQTVVTKAAGRLAAMQKQADTLLKTRRDALRDSAQAELPQLSLF